MLGELKVSPPRGKAMSDELLGKKSLSQTAPLSSLKPLREIGGPKPPDGDGIKSGKSLSKSLPRKTVRLADPLEDESTVIHTPPQSPRTATAAVSVPEVQATQEEVIEPIPVELTDQKGETEITELGEKANGEIEVKEVVETPQQSTDQPEDTKEKPNEPDLLPSSLSDPIMTQQSQIDFLERSSLQARESLIRQQYSSLSIQRVYGNILERSSIQNSLHVAIMKGDDRLVEKVGETLRLLDVF
jgi:hypothetical protein